MSRQGTHAELDVYRAVFHALPVPGLLLDADLVITDVTASYLQMVGRAREHVVGRYVFDAFPDASGESEHGAVGVSMRRALQTGRLDRLPLLEYAVQSETGSGGF